MAGADLPLVDAHTVLVTAGPNAVWQALLRTVDHAFSGAAAERYARIVGCTDLVDSGPRPLAEGSTIPGFHVATATPVSELVLEGHHRFSTYRLIFQVARHDATRTQLRAETWALFPGVTGSAYRLLVVGSGGHRIVVRRLLATIGRGAQTPSAS